MKRLLPFFFLSLLYSQDTTDVDLDLDKLWDEVEWQEITEVVDVYYEVEQITPVAGVRGSEAKYEILKYLYYRKTALRKKT